MRKIIILLLLFPLFLIGCGVKEEGVPGESGVPSAGTECSLDSDCVIGGCSGTICQSKDAEPMFTTCEWKEEYACYKQIDCGCVNGKCDWKETSEFEDCVEKARASQTDIIV